MIPIKIINRSTLSSRTDDTMLVSKEVIVVGMKKHEAVTFSPYY